MINIPKIVFQNRDFIVVDKPVGLTVNRSETAKNQETLQDYLEKEFRIQNLKPETNILENDFYKRSGIVHRLDKDTSGLIVVARNPEAFQNLQKQFKERLVKKTYFALVWGKLTQSGEVNVPISRNPYQRKRFGVFLGGREAQTKYSVVKNSNINGRDATLLKVYPLSGRTHQIRVHLNYIGHPIVGDPLYSGRKLAKEGQRLFGRLMLHAFSISFKDPTEGVPRKFKADLPPQFKLI